MTTGSPPSMTAITELVVPRSIPTVLGMSSSAVWVFRSELSQGPSARNQPARDAGAARTVQNGTLTAVARSIDLDPIDGIGVGTIGPPGRRQFFLRASSGGESIVLYCEKFHVQGLVVRMRQLLEAQGMAAPPAAGEPPAPAKPAQTGDPDWTI